MNSTKNCAETNEKEGRRKINILICTTGSVATIKLPLIIESLSKFERFQIEVVSTSNSLHFFDPNLLLNSSNGAQVKVWKDEDEWNSWKNISDPIVHIELRRWADLILVCPCSANTLAKISNGLCDNLLTSLIRATNPKQVPVILFPSMNTLMYDHPLTRKQIQIIINEIGFEVIGPISKTLACGDSGMGAMTEWKDIVDLVVKRFPN